MARKEIIMLCPVCGTELHITNQVEVKCKCFSKLIVLKNGKEKQLVKLEDAPAARKAMLVRCRECLNFRQGDCVDLGEPKRNVDPNCARTCRRFIGGNNGNRTAKA